MLCYPERNFAGNQLIVDSMSLSPLYEDRMSDFHVNIITDFQVHFYTIHLVLAKLINSRVLNKMLFLPGFSKKNPDDCSAALRLEANLFPFALRFYT